MRGVASGGSVQVAPEEEHHRDESAAEDQEQAEEEEVREKVLQDGLGAEGVLGVEREIFIHHLGFMLVLNVIGKKI